MDRIAGAPAACPSKPTVVAVGDSITMGTQDFNTVHDRQEWSYGKQLADRLGADFHQPLLTEEGISPRTFVEGKFDAARYGRRQALLERAAAPLRFYLRYLGIPDDAAMRRVYDAPKMGHRDPETLDTPEKPQANFAVAGYELRHVSDVTSVRDYLVQMHTGAEQLSGVTGEAPLVHSALQNDTDEPRGSALDQALAKKPELILFWAGNNDALETAGGVVDDRTLTPLHTQPWRFADQDPVTGRWTEKVLEDAPPGFAESTKAIFDRLKTETDAHVLVMNLPDVTVIPFLRTMGEKVGDLPFSIVTPDGTDVTAIIENWTIPTGVRGEGKEGRTEFPEGSKVNLLRVLGAFLAAGPVQTAADLEKRLAALSKARLFTEQDVLDSDELRAVSQRIAEFNEVLRQEATGERFHLLDVHGIFNDVHREGRALRGEGDEVRVTSTFTGARERDMEGMFSYDGIHPSDTGHAVLANMMLDRLAADLADDPRWEFLRHVEPIDEKAVFRNDPHRQGGTAVLTLTRESVDALRKAGATFV